MVIDLRTARFLFDKYSIFVNVGRFIKSFRQLMWKTDKMDKVAKVEKSRVAAKCSQLD